MKAIIYQQKFNDNIIKLDVDPENLYTKIICSDCNGSGKFKEPDETECKCIRCKGTGKIHVSLI